MKFAPIITQGFGFSTFKALLLQMPLGGVEIVFLLICAVATNFIPNARLIMMIFNTCVSMMGMILVWQLDHTNRAGRVVGLALSVAYAINIPLSLSIVTSNVAGFSKKSVISGLIFVAYCVGNIVGPQCFLSSEAPTYQVCP